VKLDIGAGHRACGDVNVDLYPDETFHRNTEDKKPVKCKTHLIPNFVKADGQHLPFKDDCFDEVNSSHVLEHVQNPVLMVREMMRVSKDHVSIIVPHRFGKYAKQKCHIHYFNNKWFARVLGGFPEVYSWTTEQSTRGFPTETFSLLRLPNQITVSFRVCKNG
jgi:ubiquinone/menaquinone biosynthesis C-methylase UbiE